MKERERVNVNNVEAGTTAGQDRKKIKSDVNSSLLFTTSLLMAES